MFWKFFRAAKKKHKSIKFVSLSQDLFFIKWEKEVYLYNVIFKWIYEQIFQELNNN